MKAVHIVPRIHQQASGPTYSVTSLCASLAKLNVATSLHVTHSAGQTPVDYELHCHGSYRLTGPLCVSPLMKQALIEAARTADVLHNHSLWMMPNIYPGTIPKPDRCQLVCSPRGTMASKAFNRSRWKKRFAMLLGQNKMLHNCDCFHATSEQEAADIRQRGFSQPVAIIPNGIDCPQHVSQGPETESKTLLFLARIHPIKGVDLLLEAWKQLSPNFPQWTLNIAGPVDSPFARKMQQLGAGLPRVEFLGHVTGEEKRKLWSEADLYVLPTHSENFGVSVAEALAHGVPAIVCEGAPWQGLELHEAGWWVPHNITSLSNTLREGMSATHEQRIAMGANGRSWMERDFSWPVIAQRMLGTYEWLTARAPMPSWIVRN